VGPCSQPSIPNPKNSVFSCSWYIFLKPCSRATEVIPSSLTPIQDYRDECRGASVNFQGQTGGLVNRAGPRCPWAASVALLPRLIVASLTEPLSTGEDADSSMQPWTRRWALTASSSGCRRSRQWIERERVCARFLGETEDRVPAPPD
jgi:hypothetical protein